MPYGYGGYGWYEQGHRPPSWDAPYDQVEHEAWVQAAENFDAQVTRSVASPHLFTDAERREMDRVMKEAGFVYDGGSFSTNGKADPWLELRVGQRVLHEIHHWRNTRGRRYTVSITRKPDEPDVTICMIVASRNTRAIGTTLQEVIP